MKKKFLSKNTKIIITEEAPPPGLTMAEKVHHEDGKINKKALSDFAKKLADYYGDELKELDPVPKVTGDDEVGSDDVDIFSIEALGAGKMSALEYEGEGSDVEKKFQKRVDDLNDTSEYDKIFGTKDGFGETDEPDDTYEKMKKAAAEYNKYEDIYELPNPLRVKQAKEIKSESKNNKKKKMKRLNFKNKFNTEYEVLQLIPENYKQDGHTFLMTDNNQTYKIRWDDSLKEGTVLGYKNKSQINEGVNKMKKLYNYKYSDSMGKTNDYITETEAMRKMMESVKGKTLLGEQAAGLPVSTEPAGEVVAQKTPTVSYQYEDAGTVKVNDKNVQVYKGTIRNKKTKESNEIAAFSKPGVNSASYIEFYPNGYLKSGYDNSKIKQAFATYIGIPHAELGDNQTLSKLVPALKHIQKNIQLNPKTRWFKRKMG